MPGLRKKKIATRITAVLRSSVTDILIANSPSCSADLPMRVDIDLGSGARRGFSLYFWTIGHGGRSSLKSEYRIQTKLDGAERLSFGYGITILLGYYLESADVSGKRLGNAPPDGMEVFVAWDAITHLRTGFSTSCQVPFQAMYDAYLTGMAISRRQVADGSQESVISFRPEKLASYLALASHGHNSIDEASL